MMRLELSLKDILLSLLSGVAAGLVVVLVMVQLSPAGAPVRATLVNCAVVRARPRPEAGTPVPAELRRAERQCAAAGAGATVAATPPTRPAPDAGVTTQVVDETRGSRSHRWRKATTPPAN